MVYKTLKKDTPPNKNEWSLIITLFILSSATRFAIGDYFKNIHVYGDDLVYYQMAESFVHGLGFRINNVVWPYRILYSILISPAFLFSERHIQMSVIQLINSIVISSTIFPYSILVRQLLNSRKMRILAYSLFVLSSDLCYSLTFMSENLLFPLGMWGVCLTMLYVWHSNEPYFRFRPLYVLFLGILLYTLTTIKESGIILFPAVICMLVADTLWILIKKKETQILKTRILDLLILVSTFFLLRFIGKHTWMYLDRSLSTSGISHTNAFNVLSILHISIYLLVVYIIGVGVIPFIIPACYFTQTGSKQQKMYTFSVIMLLVGMLALGYYINYLHLFINGIPISHFRYIIYMWLPIQICFFSTMEQNHTSLKSNHIFGFAVPVILCAIIFRGSIDGSTVDQTVTYYIIRFFNDKIIIYKIGLVIIALTTVPLIRKHKKVFFTMFVIIFWSLQVLNNALIIKYHHQDYYLDDDIYAQISPLESRIKNDISHNYLIVAIQNSTRQQRLADTFFNRPNVYTVYYDTYINLLKSKNLSPDINNVYNYLNLRYSDLKHIDYIILPAANDYHWTSDMMDDIPCFDNDYWKLYRYNYPDSFPVFNH